MLLSVVCELIGSAMFGFAINSIGELLEKMRFKDN